MRIARHGMMKAPYQKWLRCSALLDRRHGFPWQAMADQSWVVATRVRLRNCHAQALAIVINEHPSETAEGGASPQNR